MFFDRYAIRIQAFVNLINLKLMSFDSSSLTFHVFRVSTFQKNQSVQDLGISKTQKVGCPHVPFFHFSESQISIDNIYPGCSEIFLDLFEVSWYNEMKKYGVPGAEKPRNHDDSRF